VDPPLIALGEEGGGGMSEVTRRAVVGYVNMQDAARSETTSRTVVCYVDMRDGTLLSLRCSLALTSS